MMPSMDPYPAYSILYGNLVILYNSFLSLLSDQENIIVDINHINNVNVSKMNARKLARTSHILKGACMSF